MGFTRTQRGVFVGLILLVFAINVHGSSSGKHFHQNDDGDKKTVEEYLSRAIVEETLKGKWDALKTAAAPASPVITENLGSSPKEVVFTSPGAISLKEVFYYLQYYPLLYPGQDDPIIFKIPVDGQDMELKLQNKDDNSGKFTAKHIYEDPGNPSGPKLETDLALLKIPAQDSSSTPNVHSVLKDTIKGTVPDIFNANLDSAGKFDAKMTTKEKEAGKTIPSDIKTQAFREAFEFMASTSVLGKKLPSTPDSMWLTEVDTDLNTERNTLRNRLNEEIVDSQQTKVRYELTASMLKTSEVYTNRWDQLISDGIVIEKMGGDGKLSEVEIKETKEITLKKTFKLLQSMHAIYPDEGYKNIKFTIPIGREKRVVYLAKAPFGKNQIYVKTKNSDYPDSTERRERGGFWAPDYKTMVDQVLSKFAPDGSSDADDKTRFKILAGTMLDAMNSPLDSQPNFSDKLEIKHTDGNKHTEKTANIIRQTVEFLTITMVAEAAQPNDELKLKFLKDVAKVIEDERRFPNADEMPQLEYLKGADGKNLKNGRSPAMDEVAIGILREIESTGVAIHEKFTNENYPPRAKKKDKGKTKEDEKKGGTKRGREHLYDIGDQDVPSSILQEEADKGHDGDLLTKRARLSCGDEKRRKKRALCSLEEVSENKKIDEKSIKVTDQAVELDVVDRRDANKRTHLEIPVSQDELATPKRIKEGFRNSKRAGVSSKYAKINKGLAVHGMIFSALSAADYFSRGDDVKGGIAVSQSLHSLGGLTGINEIAAKAGKKLLSYTAGKIAKGLKMEEGLERFSGKVERFMEKGVGKLMGDIPGVGLAFDIYFIEQDVEQLANLNLNNPEDRKLLPLRVVDLVLDVETTVLNLIGTFCPEAEVITEPIVIVLSIIRMAIDDFYIDIMSEIDKVNWKSPWAGLEFVAALIKGFLEGAADFLSGGLRRQMSSYQAEVDQDTKLLSDLQKTENYYQIVGNKEGKGETIDLTSGRFSSFGGFINFRLFDDGWATLEIGDSTGNHDTIKKKFRVDKDLSEIVLGIGETRDFVYKTKTAKLWFVIPIKDYDVICSANLHSGSLYGTYYGNSRNNKFFAVQNQKTTTPKPTDGNGDTEECNYGKIDIKFVTGNYHYNLYGRSGDDTFYLGPQMSRVTGGEGNDIYVLQSDSGKTVIDNFAEDNKRDIVVINVPFQEIICRKSGLNLDVTYSQSHHIRVNNWFISGDPTYYRHISFRSLDGVLFVPKETTPTTSKVATRVSCCAVAIDKSSQEGVQAVTLDNDIYKEVKQVVGSNYTDTITGNDLNNILDGGQGEDTLIGGRNEDTYIIRANEGCDTINNFADDFKHTTDVVVFDVPFERINIRESKRGDIIVYDRENEDSSCFKIASWTRGEQYQHMIFTSSDHIVFSIKYILVGSNNAGGGFYYSKVPLVLDYSSLDHGVHVDLSDSPEPDAIHETGFDQVATVSDSPYDDRIIGNNQSNFLSCSGGHDFLNGARGSDNYVVKSGCTKVIISNFDNKEKVDLLLLDADFAKLRLEKLNEHLIIRAISGTPVVEIYRWFRNSKWQHIWVRTKDGITAKINGTTLTLIPVEVSKDPKECQCRSSECRRKVVVYDLQNDPWTEVTRFQLQSSYCSYKIRGNALNNYIDPGTGNGYNYQVLLGRDGADTYVLKHGYGQFNTIKNYARDNKTDILQLGLEIHDIDFYFHGEYDVILASKSRPSSLSVKIQDYFKGQKHQHLQVVTSDKVVFEIQRKHPFMKILSVDLSITNSPQNISPDEDVLLALAQSIQGSLSQSNQLTGTSETKQINGGSAEDTIHGGPSNNIISGREGDDKLFGDEGDDIIFGGDGDDTISGGEGNDYIFAGNGIDSIDGGNGSDTIAFKGDGFNRRGVYIDLSGGFGKGADAEGDTYKSIEHVYGTIHNDTLVGSDSNNNLYGRDGNDVIIANGGNDKLVGGEGSDRYILHKAYGIKVIDNYAQDEAQDTISLADIRAEDTCAFLIGDDLYLQIIKTSFSSVLDGGQNLTIVVKTWRVGPHYQHLQIVFNDSIWSDYALRRVKKIFPQMATNVRTISQEVNFIITSFDGTSVRLSWNPLPSLDSNTELFLMRMNVQNPISTTVTQVGIQGHQTINALNPEEHYLFALFLQKCSATISTSSTLLTFGERRSCQEIDTQHVSVTYNPESSLAHDTTTTFQCNPNYKLDVADPSDFTAICLDSKWQPFVPSCLVINHCPDLSSPENGHLTLKGQKEGSVAHYVCKIGYKLEGNPERICQIDGLWEDGDPRCLPMSCVIPQNVIHGRFEACEHMANTNTSGTVEEPREGFCLKLNCDDGYVESYNVHESPKIPRWQNYGNIPKGALVCRDGEWIGYREAVCESGSKVYPFPEKGHDSWLVYTGLLQVWENEKWKNASTENYAHINSQEIVLIIPPNRRILYKVIPSSDITDRACQRLSPTEYGQRNIKAGVIGIFENSERVDLVYVMCPKVRFEPNHRMSEYEGMLQVLVDEKWENLCYSDYVTGEPSSETMQVCKTIDTEMEVRNPSLVSNNIGRTKYHLECSVNAESIKECKIKHFEQDCNKILRCRQKCPYAYPVDGGGSTLCNGLSNGDNFEGHNCEVKCPPGKIVHGDRFVYCKSGEWVTSQGQPASSHCEVPCDCPNDNH